MIEIRETCLSHVSEQKHASVYTSETKWINLLKKLKDKYPDEVNIRHDNIDGSILAHFPIEWLKIKPKKKVCLTEEQIEASKARLEQARRKRLEVAQEDNDLPDK